MATIYKYPVSKRTLSAPFAGKKIAHKTKTSAVVATQPVQAGSR